MAELITFLETADPYVILLGLAIAFVVLTIPTLGELVFWLAKTLRYTIQDVFHFTWKFIAFVWKLIFGRRS